MTKRQPINSVQNKNMQNYTQPPMINISHPDKVYHTL